MTDMLNYAIRGLFAVNHSKDNSGLCNGLIVYLVDALLASSHFYSVILAEIAVLGAVIEVGVEFGWLLEW